MIELRWSSSTLRLVVPDSLYDRVDVAHAWRAVAAGSSNRRQCCISDEVPEHLVVGLRGTECENPLVLAARLFSQINGVPLTIKIPGPRPTRAAVPDLSCIIVLTANGRFVRHFLLPSIVQCTRNVATEIIIVCNGTIPPDECIEGVACMSSEYGCVANAYNRGVEAASGDYIALFHDDCLLADPAWAEVCIGMLRRGYTAVTPEVQTYRRLMVAKSVPLLMRRRDYLALGGFDEQYYMGIEDIDFTYSILSAGGHVGRAPIRYEHFNGMSTVILFGRRPTLYEMLFGGLMLPKNAVRALATRCLKNARNDRVFSALLIRNYIYFIRKFESYLKRTQHPFLADLDDFKREHLLRTLLDARTRTVLDNRQALVSHFRRRFAVNDTEQVP